MIDERHSQLKSVRHAHHIGISQQSIQHVATRFQIRNAIDRVKFAGVAQTFLQGSVRPRQRFLVNGCQQRITLFGRKQGARKKIGMQRTIPPAPERRQFPVLVRVRRQRKQTYAVSGRRRIDGKRPQNRSKRSMRGTSRKVE